MVVLGPRLINFKEVFTSRILKCLVNPFDTFSDFISTIRPQLSFYFNINENEIEIVEAGQYIDSLPAEFAPSLEPSILQLSDYWGDDFNSIAFYVRRKNYPYPQLEHFRRERENRQNIFNNYENDRIQFISNNEFDGDCPICLESSHLIRRYNCSHGVCETCYRACQATAINSCSLCRSH
jgi:hypothetical protein